MRLSSKVSLNLDPNDRTYAKVGTNATFSGHSIKIRERENEYNQRQNNSVDGKLWSLILRHPDKL